MSNSKRKKLANTGRGPVGKTAVVGIKDRASNQVQGKGDRTTPMRKRYKDSFMRMWNRTRLSTPMTRWPMTALPAGKKPSVTRSVSTSGKWHTLTDARASGVR